MLTSSSLLLVLLSIPLVLPSPTGQTSGSEQLSLLNSALALPQPRCASRGLFGVTPSKARPEYREKLVQYRRDCFGVLWRAFQTELAHQAPAAITTSPLLEVRGLALAVAQMAEQQMELQTQVITANEKIDQAITIVGNLEKRLKTVEQTTSTTSAITNTQATEISNQVKALAEILTKTHPGKNHYQGIFGELYRRFGVSSYKLVRQEQYQAVLDFLERWRKTALKERPDQGNLF
jgi:hypothetical protein